MTATADARLQPKSWHLLNLLERAPGFHSFADTVADLADENPAVVAGSADLKYSNGLVRFQKRHPDRYVQFGISEQHMVTAAAGMAAAGLVPYVATFASFMALLCCEQIRTDCAWPGLPVRLIGHHAGIALGFYGTSHHATEDLAIGRSLAGLTVVAPADSASLAALLRESVDYPGPIYFRIGRGQDPDVYDRTALDDLAIGKAISHGAGSDLTIVTTGSMVHPSLTAAERLRQDGLSVGVLDMHTVKPLDTDAILTVAARSRALLSVEEHNTIGGLGAAVAETLTEAGAATRLRRHGIHDHYSLIGPPTHLYAHYGLDAAGIEAQARSVAC